MNDIIINVFAPIMPFRVARAFRTTCKKWKDLIKNKTCKPLQRNLQMLRYLERYNLTFNIEIKDYVYGEADINDLKVERLRLNGVFSGLNDSDIKYLELTHLTIINTKLIRDLSFSTLKVLWIHGACESLSFNLPSLEALILVDIATTKEIIDAMTGGRVLNELLIYKGSYGSSKADLLKHAYVVYTKDIRGPNNAILPDMNMTNPSEYFELASIRRIKSPLGDKGGGRCLRLK